MRDMVHVQVGGQSFSFNLEGATPMASDAARAWLDAQFTEMECEPLRASGKLLMADKVLVVARDAGARRFDDASWGASFAAAALAVLGKPGLRVDADALSVTY